MQKRDTRILFLCLFALSTLPPLSLQPVNCFSNGHRSGGARREALYQTRHNGRRSRIGANNGELLGVPESRGDSFDTPKGRNIAHLLYKAGILTKLGSGMHAVLPVGQKIIRRIERIIRVEMARLGCLEVVLPILQPEGTICSRLQEFNSDLYKLNDRHGNELHLSPTCEELACHVLRTRLTPLSKSQLPLRIYQINTKFRDELRPSESGMRCREFLMKDAYSFHEDGDSSYKAYASFKEAYQRIMDALNIAYKTIKNSNGTQMDEEFRAIVEVEGVPTEIEIAHIFQLGPNISEEAGLLYEHSGRQKKPVYLNAYGIGIQRLAYVAMAQHCDKDGLSIPQVIAPYDVAILVCDPPNNPQKDLADSLRILLGKRGLHAYKDDRKLSVKQRAADLRTIGVPHIVYVSNSLEGSHLSLPSSEQVDKIKASSEISNGYHSWQAEECSLVRNEADQYEDVMNAKVRYLWRKGNSEYIIPVSTLLELLCT